MNLPKSLPRYIVLSLFAAGASAAACALTLAEIRQKVDDGKYNAALFDLENLKTEDPAAAKGREWHELAGICRFQQADYAAARPLLETARQKGSKEVDLYLGRLAFLDYDFPLAHKLYGSYAAAREKAGKPESEALEKYDSQLLAAENALSRVEKIVIIDSLAVPVESFIKSYKLPPSSGRLLLPEEMPIDDHRTGTVMAFTNEGEDFMMWAEPDSEGKVRLMESIRLTDGSWQKPVFTSETLDESGNADYPFMMPDGTTLYYAADGDESMGGFDIFVASRDAATGEYLQPQNLGMPYNSPYDDFMLAIDEENGVGWWATDRNQLDDKVTVYVFITNDLRNNYNPDEEEDIMAKARISSFRDTWTPGEEAKYKALLADVENSSKVEKKRVDFHIPLPGGRMATNMDDFRDRTQRDLAKHYLAAMADYDTAREDLETLRMQYAAGSTSLRQDIIEAERESESLLKALRKARSDFYKSFSK